MTTADGLQFESPDAGSARPAERQARKIPPAAKQAANSRARANINGAGAGAGAAGRRSRFEPIESQHAATGGAAAAEAYTRHALSHLAIDSHAAELIYQNSPPLASPLVVVSPRAAALDYAQLSAAAAAVGPLPGAAGGKMEAGSFAQHERVMLKQLVRQQVEYYFSVENLSRDTFLRSQMSEHDGRVSLLTITNFNRMRQLSSDLALIAEALSESELIDIAPEGVRPREGWQQWLPGGSSSTATTNGSSSASGSGALSPTTSAGGGPADGLSPRSVAARRSSAGNSHAQQPAEEEAADEASVARPRAQHDTAAGGAAGASGRQPKGNQGGVRAAGGERAAQLTQQHQQQMLQAHAHAQHLSFAAAHLVPQQQLQQLQQQYGFGTGARRVSPTAAGSSDSELSTAETSAPLMHPQAQGAFYPAAAHQLQLQGMQPGMPLHAQAQGGLALLAQARAGAPLVVMHGGAPFPSVQPPPPQWMPPLPQQPPQHPMPPAHGHGLHGGGAHSQQWSPQVSLPSSGRHSPAFSPASPSDAARAGAARRPRFDGKEGKREQRDSSATASSANGPAVKRSPAGGGAKSGGRKGKASAAAIAPVVIEEFVLPTDEPVLASMRDALAAAAALPVASQAHSHRQQSRSGHRSGGAAQPQPAQQPPQPQPAQPQPAQPQPAQPQPAQPQPAQPQPAQPQQAQQQPPQQPAQPQAQPQEPTPDQQPVELPTEQPPMPSVAAPSRAKPLRRPLSLSAAQRARIGAAAASANAAASARGIAGAAWSKVWSFTQSLAARAASLAQAARRSSRAQAGLVLCAALLLAAVRSSPSAQAAGSSAMRCLEGPALSAVWSVLSLRAVCHLWPHLGAVLAGRRQG